MVFYHSSRDQKTEIGIDPWDIAMTGINICFVKDCGVILKLWARKTNECSELGELFCGISKDQNVESNADDRGLDYEIPEAFQDSTGAEVFKYKNLCL